MTVLVGKQAPEFEAQAVQNGKIIEKFSLKDLRGKYVLFFFYPLDFTFVCPTELHAFQDAVEEFKARQCEVVGCSVDSVYSHLAWLSTPKDKGGIQDVTYPLVSDINKTIARDYDVLVANAGIAYRGLFLIDQEGMIRHQVVNDLPLGRSVDEALRVLDALQFVEQHGEVCPANWRKGERAMKPDSAGVEEYFTAGV